MKGKDSIITVEFTDGEKWEFTALSGKRDANLDRIREVRWISLGNKQMSRQTSDIKRISWKDIE